jgi:hypothetical protein
LELWIAGRCAALIYERRRRSEKLKERFGPEYDRLVRQHGDPQRAETVLSEREKRVSHLKLRDPSGPVSL